MPSNLPSRPGSAREALDILADGVVDPARLQAALDTLADSDVLIPLTEPLRIEACEDSKSLGQIAVGHTDDVLLMPVFTSERRLSRALPHVRGHRRVYMGRLARSWPGNELFMVIDAGAANALTLTAESVRTLLARDDIWSPTRLGNAAT